MTLGDVLTVEERKTEAPIDADQPEMLFMEWRVSVLIFSSGGRREAGYLDWVGGLVDARGLKRGVPMR